MEAAYGLGFLFLFAVSAAAGVILRAYLPEEHLAHENMDAVRMVTSLLVTFSALILSLQLSTARSFLDASNRDRSDYAAQLANLDQCLRNLGTPMEPTRARLRQYTAAVIASTWPNEPMPIVDGMPDVRGMPRRGEDVTLSGLVNRIGLDIDSFVPPPEDANKASRCRVRFGSLLEARWNVIEDTHVPTGKPFIAIIAFWLALVFLSLGLQIPRRRMPLIVLTVGVLSIASVMFVIADLNLPYGGVFGISSSAMRQALADMSR
jgi:hypothetical protein